MQLFLRKFSISAGYRLVKCIDLCKIRKLPDLVNKIVKVQNIKRIDAVVHHAFLTDLSAHFFVVGVFGVLFIIADHTGIKRLVVFRVIHPYPPYFRLRLPWPCL